MSSNYTPAVAEVRQIADDARQQAETNAAIDAQARADGAELNSNSYADSVGIATEAASKNYTDAQLVATYRAVGNWDASGGTWPGNTTGSGTGGAIRRGDTYTVSVAGTIAGRDFTVGDAFYANQATPGQVTANWSKFETGTDQATEAERGTVKEATQATVEDELTVEQTTYVSPRKLWMAFVKERTTSGFLAAVRGTLLSGLSVASTTDVAATDSILVAIGKLQAKFNALAATIRATTLAGLSTSTNALITSSDTILSALGKLQKQHTDHVTNIVLLNGSTTLTGHTNAAQLLTIANPGIFITKFDLTNMTEVQFTGRVTGASASPNTPRVILRYCTTDTTTVASWLDIGTSEVNLSYQPPARSSRHGYRSRHWPRRTSTSQCSAQAATVCCRQCSAPSA